MERVKLSQSLFFTFRGSEHHFRFNPELFYDKPLEMALHYISTYNSIPNVIDCEIEISLMGIPAKKIKIPNGAYNITDLNTFIKKELEKIIQGNNDVFLLEPIPTTSKSLLKIKSPIINLRLNDPLKKLLGFNNNDISVGENTSDNVVDIMNVTSINVEVNVVEGSSINLIKQPIIYSFFPNVGFGHKIIKDVNNPIYLPISQNPLAGIKIRLLDQKGNLINNLNEVVDIRIHLRQAE